MQKKIVLTVDALGGENGPEVVCEGVESALREDQDPAHNTMRTC